MVKPKPRIISTISRKKPCSSQRICKQGLELLSFLVDSKCGKFVDVSLFEDQSTFHYLDKHLTGRSKVLDYQWTNHCIIAYFICPCNSTITTIHGLMLQDIDTLHYFKQVAISACKRQRYKDSMLRMNKGSTFLFTFVLATCFRLSACLVRLCMKFKCLMVLSNKRSMLICRVSN